MKVWNADKQPSDYTPFRYWVRAIRIMGYDYKYFELHDRSHWYL